MGNQRSDASGEMLDYTSAADYINVTRGTLYSMVARGEIPFVRLGKRLVRFPRMELDAWLERNMVRPTGRTGGVR